MPVFISHSQQDQKKLERLVEAFSKSGIETWNPKTMDGNMLSDELLKAIDNCEVCVFLATRNSIKSSWCAAELGAFWGMRKPVLIYDPDNELNNVADSKHSPQFTGLFRLNEEDRIIKEVQKRLESNPLTFGKKWEERQRMHYEIADEMDLANQKIIIHDSLFSKSTGHPWEKGMIKALERNVAVDLVLADPQSQVYKKRYELIMSGNPIGEWSEHLKLLLKQYPNLRLRATSELYSGPFVQIDGEILFLGFFVPQLHSDEAPFIELRKSEKSRTFFEKLTEWVESTKIENF